MKDWKIRLKKCYCVFASLQWMQKASCKSFRDVKVFGKLKVLGDGWAMQHSVLEITAMPIKRKPWKSSH